LTYITGLCAQGTATKGPVQGCTLGRCGGRQTDTPAHHPLEVFLSLTNFEILNTTYVRSVSRPESFMMVESPPGALVPSALKQRSPP